MIIERVVVAPERPAVGQACPPAQSPPDRQPVQRAQDDDQCSSRSISRIGTARLRNVRLALAGVCSTLGGRDGVWRRPVRQGESVSRSTTNIQPSGRLTIMRTTAGIDCGPQDSNLQPRDSRALAFPRGLDYLILLFANAAAGLQSSFVSQTGGVSREEAGRSRRGLLLGLTPLVSEPSWPPEPGQARLRIAVPEAPHLGKAKRSRFRFPAIHPVRGRRLPFAATFF